MQHLPKKNNKVATDCEAADENEKNGFSDDEDEASSINGSKKSKLSHRMFADETLSTYDFFG